MYKVTKVIHFCYGHRLLNYEGKCRYLHGHNGKVEIELEGEKLDKKGMVRDFTDIGQVMKAWIDGHLDHRMLLRKDDPAISYLEKTQEPYYSMEENPTAESIARLIFDYAASQGLPVSKVTLWETESSFATYAGRKTGEK